MDTFDQLCRRLETWTSIHGDGQPPYDDVGALHLLAAMLRNLEGSSSAIDDPEILQEIFGERELTAIKRIAAALQRQ